MLASVGVVTMTTGFMMIAVSGPSQADQGEENGKGKEAHKVWVCKYVGTPGEDERLKDGKNPISVDDDATVGTWFNDAQGRSFVVAVDDGSNEPSADDCPPVDDDEEETDVCPNIDGDQAHVPDGMVKNDKGDCVDKDDDGDDDGDNGGGGGDNDNDEGCPSNIDPEDRDGKPNDEDGETDRDNYCVEAIEPKVVQSDECEEEGWFKIQHTRGVQYLLDGEPIEGGVYEGPIEATVTAEAKPVFELSNPDFEFELDIDAAKDCDKDSPDKESPEKPSPEKPSPEKPTPSPEETESPTPTERPTVKGTEGVPTVVNAGIPGGPAMGSPTSPLDLAGMLLAGAGLALLLAAGGLQMGRPGRGAHQV